MCNYPTTIVKCLRIDADNRDPYLSPTKKLFILIRTESAVMLPPRAYTATSGLSPISLANTATPYASRTPEANGSITFPAASNRVATRDNTILARPPPVYTNMSSARAQLNER